jgi:hypothetical protein
MLLTVRSQYRYKVMSEIFHTSKVPTKIFILSCAHIWIKINVSHTNNFPPTASPGERAPQFGNLFCSLFNHYLYSITYIFVRHTNSPYQCTLCMLILTYEYISLNLKLCCRSRISSLLVVMGKHNV